MDMLLLPAYVKKISSNADHTWTISIGTQELTPDQLAQVAILHNALGVVAFKKESFSDEERKILDEIKAENVGKSQSQRIRNTLYRVWEKNNEGFSKFQDYYHYFTEKIIIELKSRLED